MNIVIVLIRKSFIILKLELNDIIIIKYFRSLNKYYLKIKNSHKIKDNNFLKLPITSKEIGNE